VKPIGSIRFLVVLASLVAGCDPSSQNRSLFSVGNPIINGTYDASTQHKAVMAVYNESGLCSGTLISPDVVMTAGHCVYDHDVNSIYVRFGPDVNDILHTQARSASDVLLHPSYFNDGTRPPRNDIALIRLNNGAPSDIAPIPYLPNRLGITDGDIGKPMEFVGYGTTEDNELGVKMKATNNLDWICNTLAGCLFENEYPGVRYTLCYNMDPGGPCSGDSGGPAFVTRAGQEYVAGITSYGDRYCEYYGCSTRVDAFDSFIASYVGGVRGMPCENNNECNSGYCVNNFCCDSACADSCRRCDLPGYLGTCGIAIDGTPCPDTNKCNGEEIRVSGRCQSSSPLVCQNNNFCQEVTCNPAIGCVFSPVQNGLSCSDGDLCNGDEMCQNGYCNRGPARTCNDHSLCTQDSCDPTIGCVNVALPDNTSCGGGLCGEASCLKGECQYANPAVCMEDGDPCTADWCDPGQGCRHDPMADGESCGDCMICVSSQCIEDTACGADGCGCGFSSGIQMDGLAILAFFLLLGIRGRKRSGTCFL
jgi:hypothetical protein